ncbi:MAG: LytR family transcriptional regulator [Ruminococcaceae bacterium]|nr:LytR family transcriptional regulator [Oscillospiraceae bacterium]
MNAKKFFLSMLITILVVATIGGGLLTANFFFGSNLSEEIGKFLDKVTTDKVNVLIMGLDKDKIRADVIMVVSLDPHENTINVLSIPRDTRVKYSETRYDKINHAMGYQNAEERIISLVKQTTGMPIHYYCEINFEGFRNVIDILGGVEYDVPINMHYEDPAQNLSIHVNKGLQVLDGKAAEGVVRYRATYPNGDTDRISLQQDFLRELFAQKLKPAYIAKAPSIIKEIYKHVTTNFSVADATKYVKMLKKMTPESLSTYMLPGGSQYIGGVSYYVCDQQETYRLILTEFGYPEEEAAKLKENAAETSLSSGVVS